HAETEIMLDLPGGGGMGDPANRDPQLIERDLLNGYVTTERAAQDYPSAFLHEHAHSRPVGV
ncbi:MAG TPA: hypothetical protein PK691_04670, partial [Thermomicrobiales bacterium]|nr:hypothetical protein [Thermomicrobiales bacterium]